MSPKNTRYRIRRKFEQVDGLLKTCEDYISECGLIFEDGYPEYEKVCKAILILLTQVKELADTVRRQI